MYDECENLLSSQNLKIEIEMIIKRALNNQKIRIKMYKYLDRY